MLRVNTAWILLTFFLSYQVMCVPPCLYQDQHISKECLMQVSLDELKQNSELAYYLCPIYLKENLLEMSQQICYFAAMHYLPKDTMNMYNLIQVYIKRNKWIEAIQAQYQAFWVTPFDHQQKLKKVLDSAFQFLDSQEIQESKSQKYNQKLSDVIKNVYYKKYPQALVSIKKYSQNTPESQEGVISWPFLTELLQLRIMDKMGQFPDGFDLVSGLLSSHNQKFKPITWFLHHIRGNFLMHHIRFKQSIEVFKQSITELEKIEKNKGKEITSKLQIVFPKIFPLSIYNLALSLQKTNQFALSATYLRNLIEHPSFSEISNECSECYNALGFAYYQLGLGSSDGAQKKQEFRLAKKYFDYAQKYQNENSYSATFNQGALQYSTENYKQALQKFEKVIKINENVLSAKYGYLKSLYQIDKTKGEQYLHQLEKNPKINYFELAEIMYELGSPSSCLQELQKYQKKAQEQDLSLSPDELMNLYTWKGLVQYELYQADNALQSLQRAISINEQKVDGQVLQAVGDIYIQKGRTSENLEEAVKIYKKAIQRYKQNGNDQKIKHLESTIKQIRKYMQEEL